MRRERFAAVLRYCAAVLLLLLLALLAPSVWAWGLLLFCLILPPLSLCAVIPLRKRLRGSLRVQPTATKGESCEAILTLQNDSPLPVARIVCAILFTNELTGEREQTSVCLAVGAKRTVQQTLTLKSAHCGRLDIRVRDVRIFDCFGLIPLPVSLRFGAKTTVLPELFPCEVLLSEACSAVEDGVLSRRGDYGTEIYQLREYRAGDDLRRLHHKLSYKLDTPIIREPAEGLDRSLLVLWDKRTPCDAPVKDALAEVTASVCRALCDSGVVFGLGWTDADASFRRIENAEQLTGAIAETLMHGCAESGELPYISGYGRVICVTASIKEDTQLGSTVYLSCSDAGDHRFSPQDYRERLERLEI